MTSLKRDRVPSPRPIAVKEVPLIDRTEEMNVLKEAVYRAVHGEGSLVFVHGEAGIGKTRLLRELGAYAQSRGVQVLHGRCPALFRMDGVPPFILWKEVIKDYLETCTSEQLNRVIGYYPAEVAKLVPEISQKLRTIPPSFPISPEQEQNRLFEAVSQFIINLSQETPLLVVLDDLQWTDPSSLLLLHYLALGVQKTSMLVLGAYRDTEVDAKHPLTPVLAELNRERVPQSVSLKRMSLEDVSGMIKQILEQDSVPQEFCKMVYEKTRGNPFFIEEVIKSLQEEEVIYREENKWKIKEVSRIEFPETVKNVLKGRLNRLDDECQNVLTLASFIGNEFTCEALCAVSGIEENKLLELIDKLLKTGLVKHRVVRGEDVCVFADILVRDAVYEEVSPFRRKKLHNVVGNVLEKVYAKKIDEHFGELALHFLEGGDKDKALDYFLKGGEKAAGIYANAEAASYFRSALGLLEEKEGELQERERVLEQLGGIENLLGENDTCVKHWDDALLISTELQEKQKTATLHRKMANILWFKIGDKEKAKEHHEAALKILETEPESAELARVYKDVGHMHRRMGQFAEGLRWEEKALRVAERLNALDVVADSCSELGFEIFVTGDFKRASEYSNRGLTIALENRYWESALWAYYRAAVNLFWSEDYEKRMNYVEKGLELAKKIGHGHMQVTFLHVQVREYCNWGELDKAIALGEEALSFSRRAGGGVHVAWLLVILGETYLKLGEWEKSERYYEEVLKVLAEAQHEYYPITERYRGLGLLYLGKEEYAKAKESLEKSLKIEEEAGNKIWQMYSSQFLVWACVELRDFKRAQYLLESLQKFVLETNARYFDMNEKALRAMLLRAQKKYAESIELFGKALEEWESTKANMWNAYDFARRVLCEYARAHLERNQQGDIEKALNLLNRALEMFQKMGAKKDVEKTMRLMESLQTLKIQTGEKAVEPATCAHDDLLVSVMASPRELKIGEDLELEIEVTNAREEGTILLTKIAEVIPEGFAIAKKPESYRVEGDCLNMKKKRLEPSKTEEVKFVLTPKIQGTFYIKPKIVYLNEKGKEKMCEPRPVSITVKELGLKGWLKGER